MIPSAHFSPELVSVKRTCSSQASQALRSDDSTQTDQFTHIIQQVAPVSQRQTPRVSFSLSASPNLKDYRLSVTKHSLLPLIFQAHFQCFPCVNSYNFQHNISMGNRYHYHGSFKSDETNEVDKWSDWLKVTPQWWSGTHTGAGEFEDPVSHPLHVPAAVPGSCAGTPVLKGGWPKTLQFLPVWNFCDSEVCVYSA